LITCDVATNLPYACPSPLPPLDKFSHRKMRKNNHLFTLIKQIFINKTNIYTKVSISVKVTVRKETLCKISKRITLDEAFILS